MNKWTKVISLAAALILAVVAVGCGSEQPSESASADGGSSEEADEQETETEEAFPQDYYDGKTITWIVSGSPGGGTDSLMRAYAPFLLEALPGDVDVEFRYMEGGGGVEAANFVHNQAEPDGLTITSLGSSALNAQLLDEPGVEYDYNNLTNIANFIGRDQMIIVRTETGVSSFEDLLNRDEPLLMGARSPTHGTATFPLVLDMAFEQELFSMVYGYEGGADVSLDMERGALDGRSNAVGSILSGNPEWIENDFIRGLVFVGKERHPDFPDVPTVDEILPEESKELLQVLRAPDATGRGLVTSPDAPAGAVELLRNAAEAMSQDPEFQKVVEELGFPFQYTPAEEIDDAVATVLGNEFVRNTILELLSQDE